jgi:hypothetical protein
MTGAWRARLSRTFAAFLVCGAAAGCGSQPVGESSSPAGASESAASPVSEARPYVGEVCAQVGGLLVDLETAFKEVLPQDGASIEDDPVRAEQIADAALAVGEQYVTRVAEAREALDAAEPAAFDGAGAFADRAEMALANLQQGIEQINTDLAALEMEQEDYTASVAGLVIGYPFQLFGLLFIFVDQESLTANGSEPAAAIVASPGSLGFYREARDNPDCEPFFADYDRAQLDALLGD